VAKVIWVARLGAGVAEAVAEREPAKVIWVESAAVGVATAATEAAMVI
jgi:hypothetical protein